MSKEFELQYKVSMQMRSNWIVGYHTLKDEIFMYFVDQDEIAWVFARGSLDAVGFPEFMNFEYVEWLGEL